jgi:hypothetical protein
MYAHTPCWRLPYAAGVWAAGDAPASTTDTRGVCDTPVSGRHPRVYGIRRCIQTPEGVSDTRWRLQYALVCPQTRDRGAPRRLRLRLRAEGWRYIRYAVSPCIAVSTVSPIYCITKMYRFPSVSGRTGKWLSIHKPLFGNYTSAMHHNLPYLVFNFLIRG